MKLLPGFNRRDLSGFLVTTSWVSALISLVGPALFPPNNDYRNLFGEGIPISILAIQLVAAAFVSPLRALPLLLPVLVFIATPLLIRHPGRFRTWLAVRLVSFCLLWPSILIALMFLSPAGGKSSPFTWDFYAMAEAFSLSFLAIWIAPGLPRPPEKSQPRLRHGPLTDGRDLAYERALNLRQPLDAFITVLSQKP